MAVKDKNFWIFLIFILCGLVIGGLLGECAKNVSFLEWLSYGQNFGLNEPIKLNLNIVYLEFMLNFNINISSIIGLALAIFIYRKTY